MAKPYEAYRDWERGSVWWVRGPDGKCVPGMHRSQEDAEQRAAILNVAHALAVRLERKAAKARERKRAGGGR